MDVTQDEERLTATTRSALIREGPFQIKPKKQQIEYTNINCIRFTHTHHDVASNGAKTGTQNWGNLICKHSTEKEASRIEMVSKAS